MPVRPRALKSYVLSRLPDVASSSITPPDPAPFSTGTATKYVPRTVLKIVASTPSPLTFGYLVVPLETVLPS